MENCCPNGPKIVSPELLINGHIPVLSSTGLTVTEPKTYIEFGGLAPQDTRSGVRAEIINCDKCRGVERPDRRALAASHGFA